MPDDTPQPFWAQPPKTAKFDFSFCLSGINSDGATTVGFVLNENNNKILGVEPGDKFIHMPESMKYAAKVCIPIIPYWLTF